MAMTAMQSKVQRAQSFCTKGFLPLGFFLGVFIALVWPDPGRAVAKPMIGNFHVVQTINIMVIFLISGLTLNTEDVKDALNKEGKWGYMFGVVSILAITGAFGFAAAEIPFELKEFSIGLSVFCVVPTTLASGVAIVMNAGGNDALALLLTITTNLLGVLTIPFMVKAVVAVGDDANIDPVGLLITLVFNLLIPITVGKAVRESVPGVKPWAKRQRVRLSLTNSAMLIVIVWQTASKAQDKLTTLGIGQIFSVIASGIGLHLIYLGINYPLCKSVLKLKPRELRAVVLMASEKTLPVSVIVIGYLENLGRVGVMTVPCIVAYMAQLFIDSYLATKWANDDEKAAVVVADEVMV